MNSINKFLLIKSCSLILSFGLAVFATTACAVESEPTSAGLLFTATPEITITPTIDWFPATATSTAPPIKTPTPNPFATPAIGELIFSDSFLADGSWQNSQFPNGLIIVKEGVLTLAVKSAHSSLTTLRSDTNLIDSYIETTITIGLCKGEDQVGVLFRVSGSQSYYRFLLNCQGLVSLQQVAGGTPVVLIDWTPSNIQPGLYRSVKIGVWQSGSTIRVYLDDELQLETTSGYFKNGGVGFYARAAGDTPLTVNFTSLNVFQTSQTNLPISTP